jgi:hypothetical protein
MAILIRTTHVVFLAAAASAGKQPSRAAPSDTEQQRKLRYDFCLSRVTYRAKHIARRF